ncbi:MAG: hypothetical protein ABIR96_10435 [Bdellovibrionota bacterium]
MRQLPRFFGLLVILSFASCAYIGSYRSENAKYRSLVEKQLREERLFVRGEQRLSMKVMPGTRELYNLQSTVSPGFEFKYDPNLQQVILAVSSQNRIPFSSDEVHFRLDGDYALNVEELTSSFLIQTLYPYAHPYYRVFILDFTKKDASERNFVLESSRGSLSVKLQFSPLK